MVFRAVKANGVELIRKDLTIATPTNGQAVLNLSVAETRTIPADQSVLYEIERRIASEQTTLINGNIIVSGGVNDD